MKKFHNQEDPNINPNMPSPLQLGPQKGTPNFGIPPYSVKGYGLTIEEEVQMVASKTNGLVRAYQTRRM